MFIQCLVNNIYVAYMELLEFLDFVKRGEMLDAPDVCAFMHEMSEEARRITFELNSASRFAHLYRVCSAGRWMLRSACSLRFIPISARI